MATISITPASPVHLVNAIVISAAAQAENDATAYNAAVYPTEPEIKTRFKLTAPAGSTPKDDMLTVECAAASDGSIVSLPLILPVAGTWTVALINSVTLAVIVSTSLVVS